MSADEKMSIDERYKYLRKMQKRYQKAGRKEKSRLLNEMEQVIELHRKYLTGKMKGEIKRKKRVKQRGRTYGSEVAHAVGVTSGGRES